MKPDSFSTVKYVSLCLDPVLVGALFLQDLWVAGSRNPVGTILWVCRAQ